MDTEPSPHSETAEYLAEVVAAAGEAADQLPSEAPPGWRRTAYRAVLGAVLRDWTENGTATLDPQDTANVHGFVRDAAEAALDAPQEHRDDAFEIVLGALLDDWILNWNSDEGFGDEEEDDEEELDDLDLAYDESDDDPDLDSDGDEEGSNRDAGLPPR